MFEVPDAKRVKRSELFDTAPEREGSHDGAEEDMEVRASLNAKLADLLGLDFSVESKTISETPQKRAPAESSPADLDGDGAASGEDKKPHHDEEFEFRLFSTASASKVVLEDEGASAAAGEGGFVVPRRPLSHYLAGEPSPEQRQQYRLSAVAADDILAAAKKRSWGLEMPWRVTKIVVSAKKPAAGPFAHVTGVAEDPGAKRKRPGKKRRVALRAKDKAKKEQRQVQEKQKLEKEEHLREKKKRLNREKKLKRRQKEKEKKQTVQGAGGGGGPDDGAESASSSSGEE